MAGLVAITIIGLWIVSVGKAMFDAWYNDNGNESLITILILTPLAVTISWLWAGLVFGAVGFFLLFPLLYFTGII